MGSLEVHFKGSGVGTDLKVGSITGRGKIDVVNMPGFRAFLCFFSTKFRVLESEPYFQVGAVGELVKGDSLPGTCQGLVYERYRYLDAHPKSSK